MMEILSQIYDMFEDGASVEEVAKHFENLQSQLSQLKQEKEELSKENEELSKYKLFITLLDYKKLQQQLQAYKDKEDKLRELFEDENLKELNKYYYGDSYELDAHELRKDILQILNEGDKQ